MSPVPPRKVPLSPPRGASFTEARLARLARLPHCGHREDAMRGTDVLVGRSNVLLAVRRHGRAATLICEACADDVVTRSRAVGDAQVAHEDVLDGWNVHDVLHAVLYRRSEYVLTLADPALEP